MLVHHGLLDVVGDLTGGNPLLACELDLQDLQEFLDLRVEGLWVYRA